MRIAWIFATKGRAGTGGVIGPELEDFQVKEVPAYPPSGDGTHCFVYLRKRGITTDEAVRRLAMALGCRPSEVGVAGLKDRQAVTEQWVSVPGVTPAEARQVTAPALEILESVRHQHKLRTGHLRGNRFQVRLVGVHPEGLTRAQETLRDLSCHGMYNLFGPQRFGRGGKNAAEGMILLRGGRVAGGRRRRRFLMSAAQSAMFNAYLVHRVQERPVDRPFLGEVLQRTASGGPFCCTDPATDEKRIAAREVVPTGPLFGARMRVPGEGSRPEALEQQVLEEFNLERGLFQQWSRLAPGARRSLRVFPENLAVTAQRAGELQLSFFLPAGSYATVLLSEVTKVPPDELRT